MESNINNIIKERRSIYPIEYSGERLDEGVIDTLLENANYAPNHKSNYPWRFHIIKDASLEKFLSKAAEIYKQETASEKYKENKYQKLLSYQGKVSHAIAIVMHRGEDDNTILTEDICAVAASVENIYLSLHQYEHAAGYWSTGLGTYSKTMQTFLGLEQNETLMGFFILGHVNVKRKAGNRPNVSKFIKIVEL